MTANELTSFKVLIVDDTLASRTLLQLYVETAFRGIKPAYTICGTMAETRAALEKGRYDLAIVDASLISKGFDVKGSDAVRIIRADPENKHIAIVTISGSARHEEYMVAAGSDEFVYRNDPEIPASQQFEDKVFEALVKAADRDPKPYIALFRKIGILSGTET